MTDKSTGYAEGPAETGAEEVGDADYVAIGARLGAAIKRIGVDKSVRATKKSAKQLSRYRNGDEPPLGVIVRLAEASDLSVGWIVTGNTETMNDIDAQLAVLSGDLTEIGEPVSDGQKELASLIQMQIDLNQMKRRLLVSGGMPEGRKSRDWRDQTLPEAFTLIPRLDVQTSSGSGALVDSEETSEMLAFRSDWLRRAGINPQAAHVLTNKGDSNEPTIRDGDVLLVDTSIDHVVDSAFYVVVFGGRTLLKRVQILRDGSLVLSSDNSAYQSETVPAAEVPEVIIAARLMWFGRSI